MLKILYIYYTGYYHCILAYTCIYGRLDTLHRFSPIFFKGDNFYDFLFSFLHTKPHMKGIYSKRIEFAPLWSKFFPFRVDLFPFRSGLFPFRVDPFSEGVKIILPLLCVYPFLSVCLCIKSVLTFSYSSFYFFVWCLFKYLKFWW